MTITEFIGPESFCSECVVGRAVVVGLEKEFDRIALEEIEMRRSVGKNNDVLKVTVDMVGGGYTSLRLKSHDCLRCTKAVTKGRFTIMSSGGGYKVVGSRLK